MEILPTSSDTSIRRGWTVFAGLVIGIIAFALRWPQIQDSLWLDELHTAWCVSGSWSDVTPRATVGNQPPPYFYLLRLIVKTCGLSELSLRLPSLIAGLALIGVSCIATVRWTGSLAAGFFAAILVAIDRNCIFYSQEARPYAVLQLVAWCHAMVVWQLAHQATLRHRALFILGAVTQFYLHYTSVLFLFAEVVFLVDVLLDRRIRGDYRWKQFALDLGIVAVATLPALRHLLEIHSRRKQWELFVKQLPTIQDFWHTLRLESYLLPSIALLVAWYLLRLSSSTESDAGKPPLRRSLSHIASLLFVPAVLAWVATRRQLAALFMTRYLVSSLVAAPICAAIVSRLFPSSWLRAVAAGLTIGVSLWHSGMWQLWQRDGRIISDRRQDWRGAVEFVNLHASPSDSICYVRSGFVEADAIQAPPEPLLEEYCLAPVNSIYKLRAKAIPLASVRDIEINPEWLQADAAIERWFLINSKQETRQQFIANIEQQCRAHGLSPAFATLETFGDVLACKLARKNRD